MERQPKITGDFRAVTIRKDTPGVVGQMAIAGMTYGLDVAAGDSIDVVSAGTCVIEMPDGTRVVAHFDSGTIFGPVRVVQVEDISRSSIEDELERQAQHLARAMHILKHHALQGINLGRAIMHRIPLAIDMVRVNAVLGVFLCIAGVGVLFRGVARLTRDWILGGALDLGVGLATVTLVALFGLRLHREHIGARPRME